MSIGQVVIYFTKIFLYIYLFIYSLFAWIWSMVPMHPANFQKKTIITAWAAVQQTRQGAAQSAVEHTVHNCVQHKQM